MDDLIKEIKSLKNGTPEHSHIVMGKNYTPITIDKKNFHEIPQAVNDTSITFVDGGQATLFESAGFAIGFIRTVAITYKNNKKTSKDTQEFTILIKEIEDKFIIKTFPKDDFDGLSFNIEDETLQSGIEKASCTRLLSIIRRLAELRHASKFKNPILDGTLEARYPYELGFIKKMNNPSAVAKTCSLTTNNSLGIAECLRLMNDVTWYYYPIAKNNNKSHPADIYFIKLNNKSDYVFRFEHAGQDAEIIISILLKNSTDPIFLGYPYGLVDADHAARVSAQEKKTLQTQISMKLGKEWDGFSKMLKSMNAHDILDNIKF